MTSTPLSGPAARQVAEYADSWVGFRCRFRRQPGVQAAINVDGEIVGEIVHGHADVEGGVAMTPGHLFRIASHSKTFTATAVVQLAEQGRLRLDDRVRTHLPWTADGPLAELTLTDLLTHSAGVIRDGADANWWQLTRPFPDGQTLRTGVAQEPVVLPVAERFKYSNIGFGLLGMVIAAVTGRSYNDAVQESIVDRLGLVDTSPEWIPSRAADYAAGYSALGYADRRRPIDHVDTAALAAATGFTSTANDLTRYAAAHFDGDDRLLSDESKRRMRHRAWPMPGGPDSYGLGLQLTDFEGHELVGHGGGYPGHGTRTYFDPVGRVAVSVFVNAIDGEATGLAKGIVKLIHAAGEDPPAEHAVEGDLSRFTGRFAGLWGVTDVVRLGRRLVLISPTADDPIADMSIAVPDGESSLRVVEAPGTAGHGESVRYDFAADGTVRSITGPGGVTEYPIETMTQLVEDNSRISVGTIPGAT